jgi:predicted negative regulator of RcsB-dependent stress response
MAFDDFDEYEQGEQVRQWIKENGIAIAVGVVLALVLIFGYRRWKAHEVNTEVQAASQFAVVQNGVQAGDKSAVAAATAALGDLQKNYPKTPYAAFASAAVAEYDVGKDNLKSAAQNLQWAVDHSKQPGLKELFSLRLARVLLAQGEAQSALTVLGHVAPGDYTAVVDELRGDASLKLGNTDAARTAYQAALGKLDKDAPGYNVVQMKLDNLAQHATTPSGKQAK